jgi:hypothetical protein
MGTILTSNWTPSYSVVLLQFWTELRLTVSSYDSSARTPRKTASSVFDNACLFVRYLAMDVLLLTAYTSGMCLPSHCLAMGTCITILKYLKQNIMMWTIFISLRIRGSGGALVNTVMNLRFQKKNAANYLNNCTINSFVLRQPSQETAPMSAYMWY